MQRVAYIIIAVLLFSLPHGAQAQNSLTVTRESQRATVSQRIALMDVTINYGRPAVKGRDIWGKLVPYGEVWRAGANENTTISFTSDVTINGKALAAGTYGLHMVPGEKEWTIIFSRNSWSWGSFFYDSKEDALRIMVTPQPAPFRELLTFSFDTVGENYAEAALLWEKLAVPFRIEIDANAVVLESFRKELDNIAGFFWQGWNQAANYCLQRKIYIDEAMAMADKSISINRNFTNIKTKADLLRLQGKHAEADQLEKSSIASATEAELNAYGYQLLGRKKYDDAIAVFKQVTDRFPQSWNAWDSLAEGYAAKGDTAMALQHYRKALSMVTDGEQKKRIEKEIQKLEGSK